MPLLLLTVILLNCKLYVYSLLFKFKRHFYVYRLTTKYKKVIINFKIVCIRDKIMKYKIVVDSCCDLTADMKNWDNFEIVPLTLEIGDYRIFDDENFNQDDFIARMKANGGNAKSACPAPDAFKKAYEGDYEAVFVLTITNQLSGTYNSALQGKMLYEEEFNDDKKIIVFDSLATSGLETLVAKKIKALAESGKNTDDIQKEIESYIVNNTGLYFCLESLDALKSNGRLFALAAKVLEKIRVKLICRRTTQGNISFAIRLLIFIIARLSVIS